MDGTGPVTTTDVTQAIRESAMLADITISMWNAERTDKAALEQLKQQAGATGDVGRVVKNLLAGADAKLKEVRSAFTAVRTRHYELTLPWVANPHAERQRGPRLLPNLLFEQYLTDLSTRRRSAYQVLDEFIADLPNYVAQARANLGSLADAIYPSPDQVKAQFRIHFDFEPLPAGADFKGLPDHTLERLAKALQAKQQRMAAAATKAMWDEAKARIGHIVDRLSSPENDFKSSTIENVRELITLLPGWNLTGAFEVSEVVADIKYMLDGVDRKAIVKDVTLREDVANRAKAVADKLSRWGV